MDVNPIEQISLLNSRLIFIVWLWVCWNWVVKCIEKTWESGITFFGSNNFFKQTLVTVDSHTSSALSGVEQATSCSSSDLHKETEHHYFMFSRQRIFSFMRSSSCHHNIKTPIDDRYCFSWHRHHADLSHSQATFCSLSSKKSSFSSCSSWLSHSTLPAVDILLISLLYHRKHKDNTHTHNDLLVRYFTLRLLPPPLEIILIVQFTWWFLAFFLPKKSTKRG